MSDHDDKPYTYYVEWRRQWPPMDGCGSGTINVTASSIEHAIEKAKATFVGSIEIIKVTRSH